MKSTSNILCRILGILFVGSAILKALDPRGFGVQIQLYGIVRQADIVQWIALVVIAVEAVLGAALASGWRAWGWTLRATAALLIGFTLLIAYGWIFRGLKDCGCMGKYVPMSPLVSILKNLAMLGIVGLGMWTERLRRGEALEPPPVSPAEVGSAPAGRTSRLQVGVFVVSLSVVVGTLVFGLVNGHSPAQGTDSENSGASGKAARGPNRDAPFSRFVFDGEGMEGRDLARGPQLVAFLSASCEHCEAAVPLLNDLISSLGKDLPPVTGLVLGDEETLKQFRELTKPDFPLYLIDAMVFFELIGDAPPRFSLTNDGKEIAHWDEKLPSLDTLLPLLAGMPAGETRP